MDGITAFWMVGLNKVVCDCVLWRSGSHWYAGRPNWKSCNVCRIFSVKAIFETRESRPKLISSTREQNFQKCPALRETECWLRLILVSNTLSCCAIWGGGEWGGGPKQVVDWRRAHKKDKLRWDGGNQESWLRLVCVSNKLSCCAVCGGGKWGGTYTGGRLKKSTREGQNEVGWRESRKLA